MNSIIPEGKREREEVFTALAPPHKKQKISEAKDASSLTALPSDILQGISSYLSPPDAERLFSTCKTMNVLRTPYWQNAAKACYKHISQIQPLCRKIYRYVKLNYSIPFTHKLYIYTWLKPTFKKYILAHAKAQKFENIISIKSLEEKIGAIDLTSSPPMIYQLIECIKIYNSFFLIEQSSTIGNFVEYMIQHHHPISHFSGYTPLHRACDENYSDIAKFLISTKPNSIDISPRFGNVLTLAISKGNKDLVECILSTEHILDINCGKTSDNKEKSFTPLEQAIMYRQKEIVELLIKHGADVNNPHFTLQKPLQAAIDKGDKEIVELLFKSGAKIETDSGKMPYLHFAARKGNKEIVELLVQHGADVHEKDFNGWTACTHALEYGHPEIVELLSKTN